MSSPSRLRDIVLEAFSPVLWFFLLKTGLDLELSFQLSNEMYDRFILIDPYID